MLKNLILTAAAGSFLVGGALGASISSAAADTVSANPWTPTYCILTPWCAFQATSTPAPAPVHVHYHHHHHHKK